MGTATLDFGFVPGAIALGRGSTLQLANLTLQNATSVKQVLPTTGVFQYKAANDPFWPSIIFEPNSLVRRVAYRAAAGMMSLGVQVQAAAAAAASPQCPGRGWGWCLGRLDRAIAMHVCQPGIHPLSGKH